MKQSLLLKIALTCTIIGIIALFFILQFVELGETAINKINIGGVDADETVRISGAISKITEKNGVKFIEVEKTEKISVIVFDEKNTSHFSRGDNVEITGKVADYNGKKEIMADEVLVKR